MAERDGQTSNIIARLRPLIGKMPASVLEGFTGADTYDYSGMNPLYKGPKSRSEEQRVVRDHEAKFQRMFDDLGNRRA